MDRDDRITRLYATLYGVVVLTEVHPADAYFGDRKLMGMEFVPVNTLRVKRDGWTGGRFLILNPRKDETYAQRYFYKVKMRPTDGKETR
jgi:hypothetical protein